MITGFCRVTYFTPGPKNTMLMALGLNFGIRWTLRHLLGVAIGFAVMVLTVGFGIAKLFKAVATLYAALKVVSIICLLWLTWRIATAVEVKAGEVVVRSFTFIGAAAYRWGSPKAWIMTVVIRPS